MESWLSGRKQQFTKLPSLYGLQGFESLTLRSYKIPPQGGYFIGRRVSKVRGTVRRDSKLLPDIFWNEVNKSIDNGYCSCNERNSLTLHILELARDTVFRASFVIITE